jgi:hypothetical protein
LNDSINHLVVPVHQSIKTNRAMMLFARRPSSYQWHGAEAPQDVQAQKSEDARHLPLHSKTACWTVSKWPLSLVLERDHILPNAPIANSGGAILS